MVGRIDNDQKLAPCCEGQVSLECSALWSSRTLRCGGVLVLSLRDAIMHTSCAVTFVRHFHGSGYRSIGERVCQKVFAKSQQDGACGEEKSDGSTLLT